MPNLDENLSRWTDYAFPGGGEEWSESWGGTASLWWTVLFPRIRHFLPCGSGLEIAPGFGRFTHYLKDHCRSLVGVDLTPRCVAACQQRFAGDSHLRFVVNDGRSLPGVDDGSVDFVFSFDSLVHCEEDVIVGYVGELARVLSADGVAFLHHSNLGAFPRNAAGEVEVINRHWRASTVSAATMRTDCADHGLCCIAQELVNWGGPDLIDCLSLIARSAGRRSESLVLRENTAFMEEAAHARRLAELYSSPP